MRLFPKGDGKKKYLYILYIVEFSEDFFVLIKKEKQFVASRDGTVGFGLGREGIFSVFCEDFIGWTKM